MNVTVDCTFRDSECYSKFTNIVNECYSVLYIYSYLMLQMTVHIELMNVTVDCTFGLLNVTVNFHIELLNVTVNLRMKLLNVTVECTYKVNECYSRLYIKFY